MSERVRVLHDGDGRLVAAKAAPGFDPDRVERETALLERVHHPGVVELVGLRSGAVGTELWTRWVGARSAADLPRPLPPARIAGIVLAVGATLADLHRAGVVHGAIEASHVLLDPFGRPVLCGFGRAAPIDQPLGPSDDGDDPEPLLARPSIDVAGLGGLLTELLDDGESARNGRSAPRPRRPARGRAGQVRALREVAAQATVPDPRDRPGLHAVLDGIRRAVPHAALTDIDPAVTQSSFSADRPSPTVGHDAPEGAVRARKEATTAEWATTQTLDPDGHPTEGDETDDDPVAALLRAVLTPPPMPADRTVASGTIPAPRPAGSEFDDLWIDAPRASEPSTSPLLDQLDRLRPTDDPDRELRSRRRLTTAGVAVVVAAVGFVGMSSVVGGSGGSDPGDPIPATAAPFAPSSQRAAATAGPTSTTSTPSSTGPEPTAPVAEGDVGSAPIVEHEGRRFQVGEPGDLTAVADWRCDGRTTLALYRPSTGATFVFDSWPRPGERAETNAVVVAPGGTGLEPGVDGTGCPTLAVIGASGPLTTLTVEDLR